ncbi:MAG TPA: hypothetical protein VNQ76_05485 [Planctomicrobium sp.]|nr:hypothetical protein [Planctomicrobium sp.]
MLKFPKVKFFVRATGSVICCLMAAIASAGETNSAPDSVTELQTAVIQTAILASDDTTAAESSAIELTSHYESPECVAPPAECGQPVQYTTSGCQQCQQPRCCHKGLLCRLHYCKQICHLHSTCDLYPHFAYFPEHHGYYYFRPYNYTTVLAHQSIAGRLGVDPANPYSVSLLNPILDHFAEKYPAREDSYEQVLPQRVSLPLLEDMLERK